MSADNLIDPHVFSRLAQLAQFFVWRRKAIHDEVVENLRSSNRLHANLVQQHTQALARQQHALTQLNEQCGALRADLLEKSQKIEQTGQENIALRDKLSRLECAHEDTRVRFQLVSHMLAARPAENAGLSRFRELLKAEDAALAEAELPHAAGARALLMLRTIERELAVLVDFPEIAERTIVGIVGSFNSGKSTFINSFIKDAEIQLAVGLRPVTVIPTYVFAVDQPVIRGYSTSGGFAKLDPKLYRELSHAFLNSFNFDLKTVMPFMCVGAQMDSTHFGNICFIDTPGYNPPATAGKYTGDDKRTAVQFARRSDAMLWLIGLDANGTIPKSDLNFIREIEYAKPIYVVLNKADLKPEDELDSIMDEVQEHLEIEGIEVSGICAYSSTKGRVIAYRGSDLMSYFDRLNQKVDAERNLCGQLDEVFGMYEASIEADIKLIARRRRFVRDLGMDALQEGGSELLERMGKTIYALNADLENIHLDQLLKRVRARRQEFRQAIEDSINAVR